MIEIQAVADIANKINIQIVIEYSFAMPYQVRSFEYGAYIVIHSAIKSIGWHGKTIVGIIVES